MSDKRHTSKYVTKECIELMRLLARKLGVSQNAVMEIAIRNLAKKEKIISD